MGSNTVLLDVPLTTLMDVLATSVPLAVVAFPSPIPAISLGNAVVTFPALNGDTKLVDGSTLSITNIPALMHRMKMYISRNNVLSSAISKHL